MGSWAQYFLGRRSKLVPDSVVIGGGNPGPGRVGSAQSLQALDLAAGHEGAERELEEGVQGHTARVDRSHAGWGSDDHALGRVLFQPVQEGCLAGTAGAHDRGYVTTCNGDIEVLENGAKANR